MNEDTKPRGNKAGRNGKADPENGSRINLILPGDINAALINYQNKHEALYGSRISKQRAILLFLRGGLGLCLALMFTGCEAADVGWGVRWALLFVAGYLTGFIFFMLKKHKNKNKY